MGIIILKDNLLDILKNVFMITGGCAVAAIALNGILIPHQFVSGGIVGISILLNSLFPFLSVSIINFILNIPIFAAGWIFVRRRFFLYSIAGILSYTIALHFLQFVIPVHDKILAAILAGIISGIGGGMILKTKGSGGGLDILSVILLKKFSIRVGSTILGFNSIVLVLAGLMFSIDSALYTLVYIFVTSKMTEVVLTGLTQRKVVFILSDKWRDISGKIRKDLSKGITVLNGSRAASGKEAHVLFTVATVRESVRIKEIVNEKDKKALIVIQETVDVAGRRMDSRPDW